MYTELEYRYKKDQDGNPTDVKFAINGLINGYPSSIPLNEDNADYKRIMELVEAGELTIAE
jgi:hypothetical protein